MELAVQSTPAPAVRKWAALGSLLAGAGTVYKLYFATDVFYVQFQELMHLTHTQIGVALSVAGFISQFGFLVSIYLSDRFSKKYMIPTALIGTGLTGVYLASMPGWIGFLAAMCVFAIFADMLFWPIMLKTVRLLGGPDQQGRMFGILEAGRGLVDTLVAAAALSVFAWMGQGMAGFKAALLFYAAVVTVIGVAAYFLIEDDPAVDVNARGERVGKNRAAWEGALRAVKNPYIWLVAFNVFMVYSVYSGLRYFVPFLKNVYGLPVVLVAAYGIINQYGLKMFGGPVGGLITDKVLHSATKFLRIVFVLVAAALVIFLNLPHQSLNVYAGMAITLGIAALVFCMRAVFFAPMEEIKVPREITGSAMSLGSFIGYMPGAFLTTIYGKLLDTHPGLPGYKMVFATMAGFAVAGFLLSTVLVKVIKNHQQRQAA